jgi:hypothetical protein
MLSSWSYQRPYVFTEFNLSRYWIQWYKIPWWDCGWTLPPSVEIYGEEEYQVSGVEDHRIYQSQLQYLIRWMDHDSLTWAPGKFVDALQVVGEFLQRYTRKPGLLGNALGGPRAERGDIVTAL